MEHDVRSLKNNVLRSTVGMVMVVKMLPRVSMTVSPIVMVKVISMVGVVMATLKIVAMSSVNGNTVIMSNSVMSAIRIAVTMTNTEAKTVAASNAETITMTSAKAKAITVSDSVAKSKSVMMTEVSKLKLL